ncbi:LLM class flavin-dependent oxidoreductase [Cognatishimia sp. SS12]|uniref:MupA/Atu3671 family FMN-dependent luciferase-like monooxygenase n=1 Tax=Cognatishimia sp. SS12 TaxID=2979465 RepID=UPI00232FE68E|nr:MupA/Atu3671 family FMN-dependent luciferase-like monooxygenase [Cognatishimia sp. SS12]MDC0736820.1 LLM class flavin-dependent oxidoreductase [Cognatishimia sp. SS12]
MNIERPSGQAPQRALMIGNESLLIECAKIWRAAGHDIAMILTRNDAIAAWAKAEGLPCQHHDGALSALTVKAEYDWLLSIANLQIIPERMLRAAQRGAVNFHDGPLPDYAGLNAPVWARLNGEYRHGISWHMIENGIDEGDILVQRLFDIRESDTALTLNTKSFGAALDSFPDVVAALSTATLPRQPQDLSKRRYFARDQRPEAFGRLSFDGTSSEIINMVRALDHGDYFNPLTCPKISLNGVIACVGAAEIASGQGQPGQILDVTEAALTVATADGAVTLSGLTDAMGRALQPADIAQAGQPLAAPQSPERLTAAQSKIAPHESFWRDVLAGFVPAKLPLIATSDEAADFASLPVDLPEGMSVAARLAAIALLAETSGSEAPAHLALVAEGMTHAAGYVAPWVPFALRPSEDTPLSAVVQSAEDQFARLCAKDSYALDLVARAPDIAPITDPDIAVICDPDASTLETVPLNLVMTEAGLRLRYDQNRVTEDHAARLMARLALIARQVADGALLRSALDPLPVAERDALVNTANETAVAVDLDQSMVAAIAAQAAETPDKTAVVFAHGTLTYAELEARATRTAAALIARGVQKGDIIGVHCKRSLDLVVACLAVMKAGAAYLPLDPSFPADRIALYIEDSATQLIITQSTISAELPDTAAQLLEIDVDASCQDTSPGARADLPAVSGRDLAYMIYTSGSTGRPKGVMVEHGNVANFFAGMDARIPPADDPVWLAVTSLSFDISVLELFYTLSRGYKLVLSGDESATQISNGPVGSGGTPMDFSLYYWGNDDGAGSGKYRLLLEGAKFADDNGFCAIWTPERHFHAFGGPYPNPSVTGAAVAGMTRNIGVRAGSCVAPLHHTARIAEEWAVIDNLTNGKAGLAIASGWQPDDFVLRPENTPPANKPAMFEQIKDLRKLWRGEAVEFARQDGSMMPVITQPRPVSEQPDLWVTTAGNPETWREAGRNGTHVLTHLLGQSIGEVAEKIALYHDALREAGHDPKAFKVTLMLHSFVGADREEVREIARDPMKDYLRSAAGLIKQYAWAFPAFKKPEGVKNPFELDLGSLNDEELEGILDFAFLRYFEDSGLFGTVEDCVEKVEALKKIGVTEVACLIDYGIDTDVVLEGLKPLAEVVARCNHGGGVRNDDVSIAGQIMRHKATHLQCTPAMARMLTMDENAAVALGQIDQMLIGGEALSGTLVAEINALTDAKITNMYGPTETTIWSSTAVAQSADGVVSIGTPIANTQFYVLGENMQPVPLGVAGELYIGGAGVTRGYWQRPELTAERFVDSPFEPGARLYRTGDLVRARLAGGYDFIGRADFQVKLRGYRIELGEIESRLEEMAEVAQAVVIAREDTPGDVRLVAYLRGSAEPETMRAHLAQHMPDYMVPSHFVTLQDFPLTPNKKVDRKALPAPQQRAPRAAVLSAEINVNYGAQSSDIMSKISEIWCDILGLDSVHAGDNFFDLGGHSLLAVQAHRLLRDSHGYDKLSITDIFRFPVLSALADRVASFGTPQVRPSTKQPAPAPTDSVAGKGGSARQEMMSKRRALRARRREKSP